MTLCSGNAHGLVPSLLFNKMNYVFVGISEGAQDYYLLYKTFRSYFGLIQT